MSMSRPDWEETERRRFGDYEWGVSPEWLRPPNHNDWEEAEARREWGLPPEIVCITCHNFSSSSPEVMALHALGCEQVELVPLAVVVEAELLLMAAYAERHGCGCPKHRPWSVV